MVVNFTPTDMMESDWYASNDVLRDHVLINSIEDALKGLRTSPTDATIERLIAYSASVPVSGPEPAQLN